VTTIKISYDRRDALFHVIETGEGIHEYDCAYGPAWQALSDDVGPPTAGGIITALLIGKLRSITLEV
jgi:hypothetical protein